MQIVNLNYRVHYLKTRNKFRAALNTHITAKPKTNRWSVIHTVLNVHLIKST